MADHLIFMDTAPEAKWHDVNVNSTMNAAGVILPMSLIPQGSTDQQRDGRRCILVHLGFRFEIFMNSSAGMGAADISRVLIVQDKQTNGALAVVTDVLDEADYQSHYNLTNEDRFKILWDKTWEVSILAGAGNGTTNLSGERRIAVEWFHHTRIPMEFSAATGAITEITSNSIFILHISSAAETVLSGKWRTRFVG